MSESTVFYKFGDNSFHTRGFTWAMSIRPRSEMTRRACSECGSVDSYPSGAFDVVVERGTRYPDVLGCGAYPFLIVSEAVITAWRAGGVTSFHTYPVGIAEVQSKKLRDVAPPPYFRVEIDGRCQIDLAASNLQVERICPKCQRVSTRFTVPPTHTFRMVPGSWDGSPLFRDVQLFPRVNFCTQVVLDLAAERRLTNFRFEPMDRPPDPSSRGIEYMKRARTPRRGRDSKASR